MTSTVRGRSTARHRARTLTRREAIAAGGTGLALLGLAARRPGVWDSWGPALAYGAAGEPLQEPEVRLSTNGLLETTLEARTDARAGTGGVTHEEQLPGPILRLRPGDRLKIKTSRHPDRPILGAGPHRAGMESPWLACPPVAA